MVKTEWVSEFDNLRQQSLNGASDTVYLTRRALPDLRNVKEKLLSGVSPLRCPPGIYPTYLPYTPRTFLIPYVPSLYPTNLLFTIYSGNVPVNRRVDVFVPVLRGLLELGFYDRMPFLST